MSGLAGNVVWKGILAGMAAGLAGARAMGQSQTVLKNLLRRGPTASGPEWVARQQDAEQGVPQPATVSAANSASEVALGRKLLGAEKQAAGPAMHYMFGGSVGAAYGGLGELLPHVRWGGGVPFALGLWLAADEVAVPGLRLSGPATTRPPSAYAYSIASHVVYGLTLESFRRALRRLLG
jgi:putative membrane protein